MNNTSVQDRDGSAIVVGDIVEYRLCDSQYTTQGTVTEIRDSGAVYIRNTRNGYCDLMYGSDLRVIGAH